jgi:outer membrane protein OmpA-like peptidoglycan-associated protein
LIVLLCLLVLAGGSFLFGSRSVDGDTSGPGSNNTSPGAGTQVGYGVPPGPPGSTGTPLGPAELPPPADSTNTRIAASEWKKLRQAAGAADWARLMDSAARVLAPFFDKAADAAAAPVDLARAFLQQLVESAGSQTGTRVVDAIADYLLELGKNEGTPTTGTSRPLPVVVRMASVRFELDSADLPPSGQQAVKDLVSSAMRGRTSVWVIRGSTDRSGSSTGNAALALKRTNRVMEALVDHGIDKRFVSGRPLPPLAAPVPTPDGAKEPENRKAQILVLVEY